MAEIARDADVSTATLYKHFSSKEVLFRAVIENAYNKFDDRPIMDIRSMPARDVLLEVCGIYMRQQFDGQMNEFLRIVMAEVPSAPQLARDLFEHGVTIRYKQFKAVLDALIARGDLKPHDTDVGVRQLGGMVKEFIVWPALFVQKPKIPDDIDDKIVACIDMYLSVHAGNKAVQMTG